MKIVKNYKPMLQQQALDILKMGYNVFLTGSAGSGKTYVLNEYINYLKEKGVKVGVTAATGIAATHLGGITIHSWSGLGIRDELNNQDIESLLTKRHLRRHFLDTQVLVIDEVSMLHAHQLDLVNQLAQAFRQDMRPFGGLQVVLSGDFFQLPPIVQQGGQPRFILESEAWQTMHIKVCYLEGQYRQADADFLNVLNQIRQNSLSRAGYQLLLSRLHQPPAGKLEPTRLHTHNINVDAVNAQELAKLKGRSHNYLMRSHGRPPLVEILKKGCLAPEDLTLKIGAKVMFVKNNFELDVVNGTLGQVVGFDDEDYPIILTKDGQRITVYPTEWSIQEDGRVLAEIQQLPLRLAWAITVHKSQGMSLDAAEVDLSKSFVPGMGYVALSRLRSLAGLTLRGINDLALQVDQRVLSFDQVLRQISLEVIGELEKLAVGEKIKKQAAFIGVKPGSKKTVLKRPANKLKTAELVRQKKTVPEIAKELGLKPATVIGHLEKLLTENEDIDIAYLLPDNQVCEEIQAAFEDCGWGRLKPVYEYLDERYSYDILRLIRVWQAGRQ